MNVEWILYEYGMNMEWILYEYGMMNMKWCIWKVEIKWWNYKIKW